MLRGLRPLFCKGQDKRAPPPAPTRPCKIHPRLCHFCLAESIAAFLLTRGARGGTTVKDLNRVQLIGHLGHDPEVTYTATGTARTTFSVATRACWKDADGQVQEATEWTRCGAWGALAEVCAQYLTKGSHVYVAGRLHTRRWHDAATGQRHARVEIVLDDLIMLDRRGGARVATDDDQTAPF